MKNNLPKQRAHEVLWQNKLSRLTDCRDLRRIIESSGFTIISYKKSGNAKDVSALIKKLGVEKEVAQSDSFLYLTGNLRLLFINADVPDEDRGALLRHELGHITDPHFKNGDARYSKIKKEEFANEFSFYSQKPGVGFTLKLLIVKKRKWLLGSLALLTCAAGLFLVVHSPKKEPATPQAREASAPPAANTTYFVTSGGKKYHQKFCIIVRYRNNVTARTIEEAVSAGYEPCALCIAPEK